jgi:uncharacterized integral membrane protein
MRTLFRLLVVLPIAIVIVAFAVANRHWVTVSFDPFPGNDISGPQITAPLFLLLFLSGMIGVFAGGCIVWFRQGRHRRDAREAKAEAAEARGQAADLRDRLAVMQTPTSLPGPRRDAA